MWAPSSEFVSSSIPSWQILTAHAWPFRGARDLAFCLKVPLDSLPVWASSGGSGKTARMHRLAWTFAARIGDKYQIRLTRSMWFEDAVKQLSEIPMMTDWTNLKCIDNSLSYWNKEKIGKATYPRFCSSTGSRNFSHHWRHSSYRLHCWYWCWWYRSCWHWRDRRHCCGDRTGSGCRGRRWGCGHCLGRWRRWRRGSLFHWLSCWGSTWFGPCFSWRNTYSTWCENVSLGIFDPVRFKPACSATEAS